MFWSRTKERPLFIGLNKEEEPNVPFSIWEIRVKEIVSVDVDDDGLSFDSKSIQVETITETADYQGIRIRFIGTLDSARINMQIDVGFGDVIFPSSEILSLPAILDFPAPKLLCYSKESVIAEKFEAMLKLGELNSRMKDFYDIYLLSHNYEFDMKQLAEAIRRTLEKRETSIPEKIMAFSPDFVEDKQSQWIAFLNRINDTHTPTEFSEIISSLRDFLNPIIAALTST